MSNDNSILLLSKFFESFPKFNHIHIRLDHNYAKFISNDQHTDFPTILLFMKEINTEILHHNYGFSKTNTHDITEVNVVTDCCNLPLYDLNEAKTLMKECENYVEFLRTENMDNKIKEKIDIDRKYWIHEETNLFNNVMRILQADKLARLAYEGHKNEPVFRRLVINRSSQRFRKLFADLKWDKKLVSWIHSKLIDYLHSSALAAYLDILQTLSFKLPDLINVMIESYLEKMESPNNEAIRLLLNRPWNPVYSFYCKQKLPSLILPTHFILVSFHNEQISDCWNKRMKFFKHNLSSLGKVSQICVVLEKDKYEPATYLDKLKLEVTSKIQQIKVKDNLTSVILLAWNFASVISCQIAHLQKVTSIVCLGFPIYGLMNNIKLDENDSILNLQTPVQFIIGQCSSYCKPDYIENLRTNLNCQTELVIIGKADDNLRVEHALKKKFGISQDIVDRCILEKIIDFNLKIQTNYEKLIKITDNEKKLSNSENNKF